MATLQIGGWWVDELVHDYTEVADGSGLSSTKSYVCVWEGRYPIANALLGLTQTVGVGGQVLTGPYRHPESNNMVAQEVRIKGIGTPYRGPIQLAFPYARIDVVFRTTPWLPYGDLSYPGLEDGNFLYATQNLDFDADFVSMTHHKLVYASNTSRKYLGEYAFPVGVARLVITFYRFPFLPDAAVKFSVGKINSTPCLGCLPRTLRFDGARSQSDMSEMGKYLKSVTYMFSYRDNPKWDEAWDPVAEAWDRVVTSSANLPFVFQADLNLLFPDAYLY